MSFLSYGYRIFLSLIFSLMDHFEHFFIYFLCWWLYSDIRGVAVAGVEGEPVSLTEPVAEAIAAGFAAWLVEKKKADASQRLKVSIGHDSRISAQALQVFYLSV